MSEIYNPLRPSTKSTRISRMISRNTNKCLRITDVHIIPILSININNKNPIKEIAKLVHLIPLVMPKKSSRILSFSYSLRHFFYLGASILMTLIFFIISIFLSVLAYKDGLFSEGLYSDDFYIYDVEF